MGGDNSQSKRAADAYNRVRKLGENKTNEEQANDRIEPVAPVDAATETGGAAFEKVGEGAPEPDAPSRDGWGADRPVEEILRDLTGTQRVARLLISLGPEQASDILSRLEPEEIERVAEAVIRTPKVKSDEARAMLEAIGRVAEQRRLSGGPEVAREMLVRAFGQDKGEAFFREAVPEHAPVHFEFLEDLEAHQLKLLFHDESAGAVAVVIPHLGTEAAARVLGALPSEQQAEVVRRVASMGRLNRDVILKMEEAIREKIRRQGKQVTQSVDGSDTLAAILRHMAPSEGSGILSDLEETDPGLSRSVKELLYTSDMLLLVAERDLADLLREFTDPEIALFLKGKSEELRSRILTAVSERRRLGITEEYVHQGPQKREDVDEITHELLERLRALEEDGTILVPREGERYI